MTLWYLTKRIVMMGIVLTFLFLTGTESALAGCTYNIPNTQLPSADYPAKYCKNAYNSSGAFAFSEGFEVYSCGTYFDSRGDTFYGCYWHYFECDTQCAGGSSGGGGTCPAGQIKQDFYSCDRKVDGCTGGTSECTGSQCAKCKSTEISCSKRKCVCATSKATNIVATRTGGTSATLDWTKGSYATDVRLYIGANQTEVNNACPTSGACAVKELTLPANTTHYETNVLDPGVGIGFCFDQCRIRNRKIHENQRFLR